VLADRSDRIITTAPDRTGRVNRSRTDVIRTDQLNSGSSFRFIEKQRMLRIVRKKFREVRAEDRPETSRPDSRKYIEDGERDRKEVDRGG
jgi:hypothetical protein